MIGNDIVDLTLARKENKSGLDRYLRKVFSEKEIEMIRSSEDPELVLWQLWSMKEATYKAHQRNTNFKKILNPIKYQCDLTTVSVDIDNYSYKLSCTITSDYVHSYISWEKDQVKILKNSDHLNANLLEVLSEANNMKKEALLYFKNANHLPVYSLQNKLEPLPLSLSHHGQFAAIVFPLINS